jgi:hypothetical protein
MINVDGVGTAAERSVPGGEHRDHVRRHAPRLLRPAARLADMDANGVEASLCFPNIDQIVV